MMLDTIGTPAALNCTISPAVPRELVKLLRAVPPAFAVIIELPVNDLTPVPPWLTLSPVPSDNVTWPVRVEAPLTTNISSIVVVPPDESIVRLPDVVSISLSPVIPT